jgi:light-regulated signal transduction histidine kinase (bacteriophytochrome)
LPVREESGAITKWFGSCTDIHARKEVEDELRRANVDLEQFAFSATHDLQEPLRGARIYSELLMNRYASRLDGEALEFLGYLHSSAERMQRLVDDLLAYTRTGTPDGPLESIDANAALASALSNLNEAISETAADIRYESLPSVRMHGVHLQQLFQNLIGNAIKYRNQERTPLIEVTAERENGDWIFSVTDNGIGIEAEYTEGIFGLFKRLHNSNQYSGTGIGLAICHRIVDRYKGRIWVESTPGKGSAFRFALPV